MATEPRKAPKAPSRRPSAAELDEPVSLYPLDPEKALAALLEVDPHGPESKADSPATKPIPAKLAAVEAEEERRRRD